MSDFKVGDKVRIKDDCSSTCYLRKSQKGAIGYVTSVDKKYLFIRLPGYSDNIYVHYYSCIEHINKGFNPNEIISKAFGV